MTLAVLEQDLFGEVATSIEHLLEGMMNTQMVLYELCKTPLPEKEPIKVARVLSLILDPLGQRPYLDSDANRLLARLQAADPGIGTMPEFEELAKTGWFDI